jgi:inorganic triphosphatase YgiF
MREVELKFAMGGDGQADALAPYPVARTVPQVTTYFDTADDSLIRLGASLRVRRVAGRFVQTLKADRIPGVAANRTEIEWPVETDQPDLDLVRRTRFAALLPDGFDPRPVVTTDVVRTIRMIDAGDGTRIEAALDHGVIRGGSTEQPIKELELELVSGDAGGLLRWALALHAACPLTIESESKAERGYRLKDGLPAPVQKAKSIALGADMPAGEAFGRMVNAALGHLLGNQAAAREGDPDGVHQMRVAIRRLRAVLVLFGRAFPDATAAGFQAELRRVGRILGEARDWDVFCTQTLPPTEHALRLAAMSWRQIAHSAVAEELAAPKFTALVLAMAAWVADGALAADVADRRIGTVVPPMLDHLRWKVVRRGRHLAAQTDVQRHALRRSVKKLRYAADFVKALYSAPATDAFLADCEALQTILGDMNDVVTASVLASRLGGHGFGPVLAALQDRHDQAALVLDTQWRVFQTRAVPWG